MTENSPQTITARQAKAQIDHFGRSLILYLAVFMLLRYGTSYLEEHYPAIFHGYNPTLVMLTASCILMLIIAFAAFAISAHSLHLNIHDYLGSSGIQSGKMFALLCIGIGIELITTSITSLFYFFFHTESAGYAFVGNFTTQENLYLNIAYFVMTVIIKPICDEYIFRGIIQRQLGHYGRHFGVFASSFLYAIAQANLVQAIPSLFVGWYLADITLHYHSIRPAIGIHMFISLFIWVLYIIPDHYLWVLTIFIVLIYAVAALSLFQKQVIYKTASPDASEGKLWKILLTSPTVIITIALFAVNVVLSMI